MTLMRVLGCCACLTGTALAASTPGPGQPPDPERLWSLAPLVSPPVPGDESNPIDAFVAAKLREVGLAMSSEADRRTLLRRLSYVLTGLPPAAHDLEAFRADPDPTAYGRWVDRLLASPRYGEHWARHWLDVANYADTHGNDHDYARPHAWPYRDYVIRAFNEDKPYARFVLEQVAGDALFPDAPEATVALGFLAAGPWDHTLMVTVREDTVDHRLAQNLDRDAMVGAVFGTFQSLTVHCARCHDHKFDPVSQREYYSLQAVFAGVDRADRPFDDDPRVHAERGRWRAEKWRWDHAGPELDEERWTAELAREIHEAVEALARREEAWSPFDVLGVVSTGGATLTREADGSWFAEGLRPDQDTYLVTARWRAGTMRAIRLEVLPDDRLPQRGPGRWDNGNFHLSEFRAFAATHAGLASGRALAFSRAIADFDEGPAISAAQAIDGKDETHWGVHPRYGEAHEAVFELGEASSLPDGAIYTFMIEHRARARGHGIGRFRLSATGNNPDGGALEPLPATVRSLLKVPASERTPAQRRDLAVAAMRARARRALAALPAPRMVYAVTRDFPPDGENFKPSPRPRPIHVLRRGDLDKPGERVDPGTLGCIPGLPADLGVSEEADESARRAALARWLVDPRNVLTWRSIVNRVWSYHFGRGLCDTPNDFGRMGGVPSHPELLDWLAVWFRDEAKGSLKALHRLILTSRTWRQSTGVGRATPEGTEDRWLGRQHRRRLTAEEVRDTLSFLAGRLDSTMGGPPAVQFLDRGDATFNPGGNPPFVDYEHFDFDSPAARRRAVYRFLFRTVPDPFMSALDCPDGGAVAAVRDESTTVVQALAMLNDPFVIRRAEDLARLLEAESGQPEGRVDALFRRVLLRDPTEGERTRFAEYVRRHGLANAVQWLWNANEFLYLD